MKQPDIIIIGCGNGIDTSLIKSAIKSTNASGVMTIDALPTSDADRNQFLNKISGETLLFDISNNREQVRQKKIEPPKLSDKRRNWMRNWPCPCGSGKKFKQCCWSKGK